MELGRFLLAAQCALVGANGVGADGVIEGTCYLAGYLNVENVRDS